MESSRTNYTPKSEEAVNRLIAAYTEAELTYIHAAAYAAEHEKIYLKNFARYFETRAHEMNTLRNNLMRYQTRRGGNIEMHHEHFYQHQQLKYPKKAEEMKEMMKQLTATEKHLEEQWRHFYEVATAEKDHVSAQYAGRYLSKHQYPEFAKMVRLTNALQQAGCVHHFDATVMKAELEDEDEGEDEDEDEEKEKDEEEEERESKKKWGRRHY
ncbi:fts3-like protein [Sparganum proliferum]